MNAPATGEEDQALFFFVEIQPNPSIANSPKKTSANAIKKGGILQINTVTTAARKRMTRNENTSFFFIGLYPVCETIATTGQYRVTKKSNLNKLSVEK
jgi:hypothetical protein